MSNLTKKELLAAAKSANKFPAHHASWWYFQDQQTDFTWEEEVHTNDTVGVYANDLKRLRKRTLKGA